MSFIDLASVDLALPIKCIVLFVSFLMMLIIPFDI